MADLALAPWLDKKPDKPAAPSVPATDVPLAPWVAKKPAASADVPVAPWLTKPDTGAKETPASPAAGASAAPDAGGVAPPATPPLSLTDQIAAAEKVNDIPAGLLTQLLTTESGLKPGAVNKASGATGIAQIEPATAKDPGYGIKPVNPNDPADSIRFAGQYLAALKKKTGSWAGAVRAYGSLASVVGPADQPLTNPQQARLLATAQAADQPFRQPRDIARETPDPFSDIFQAGSETYQKEQEKERKAGIPFPYIGPAVAASATEAGALTGKAFDAFTDAITSLGKQVGLDPGVLGSDISALLQSQYPELPHIARGISEKAPPGEPRPLGEPPPPSAEPPGAPPGSFAGPGAGEPPPEPGTLFSRAVAALKTTADLPKLFSQTKLGDWFASVFAPYTRGPEAAATAGSIRHFTGEAARENAKAQAAFDVHEKAIGSLPPHEQLDFTDAIETGRPQSNPHLQPIADQIRKTYDHVMDKVRASDLDHKVNFIENYFTHLWKDPAKATSLFGGKRPLEGSKYFAKERTIPTIADGIRAGLEPVTTNPIQATMLYVHQANKFLAGQAIFTEMKDNGTAVFVKAGDRPPEGLVKIDDRIAEVHVQVKEPGTKEPSFVKTGHYYAPERAATIINNYLSRGITGPWKSAYDLWRQGGNALNMLQLGMSGYHLVFTALDSMASGVGLGAKQIFEGLTGGDIGRVARGVKQTALSLLPTKPVMTYLTGKKVLRSYLGASADPTMARIADDYMVAGGRVRMDEFYRGTPAGSFWEAFRKGTTGQEIARTFSEKGPVLGAASFLGRAAQTLAAPIMEDIVPKLKMGVFAEMAQDALRQNPHMGEAELRQTMGRIGDSVDNRLGQLVYDNVFWNKTLKQILMATTRAVGWNLGTIREVGGGLLDLPKLLTSREMTNKTSYIVGAMTTLGLYGSIYQYLKTGKPPEDLSDVYMPRTGGRNRFGGGPERIMLPSYLKDVLDLKADPVRTIGGKLHPMLPLISQMLSNRDFIGGMIVSHRDPLVKQLEDGATYILKQFAPIGIRQATQKMPGSHLSVIENILGIQPAPKRIRPEAQTGRLTAEQKRAFRLKRREAANQ